MRGPMEKKKSKAWIERTKADLRRAGVTYGQVARVAEVSWRMVAYVANGEKVSAKVEGWIERLCRVTP